MFLPASLSVPAAANISDSTGSSSGRGLVHEGENIVTKLFLNSQLNAKYLYLRTAKKSTVA